MSAGGVPGLCPNCRAGHDTHPSLRYYTEFLGDWAEMLLRQSQDVTYVLSLLSQPWEACIGEESGCSL